MRILERRVPAEDGHRTGGGSVVRWVAFVIVMGFFGGLPGLLIGVAVAAFVWARGPAPRTLLAMAAGLLLLVPVEVLFHGLPSTFFVSPNFVRRNLAAHYLAFAGAVLLVVGIFRSHTVARDADVLEHLELEHAAGPGLSGLREPGELDFAQTAGRRAGRSERGRTRVLSRRFELTLCALAAVAFALRMIAGHGAVPSEATGQIVSSLVHGQGYSAPGALGGLVPTAERMPVVPALLLLSSTSSAPLFAARVLWALIGGATVVCVGLAAANLAGRRVGLAAAALVAFLPVFWMDSVRLGSTTVAAFLVSALVLAMSVTPALRPTYGGAVTIGLLAAVLALTRPEGILVAVALVGGGAAGGRGGIRARAAGPVLAGLAAFALVFAPWVVRGERSFDTILGTTEVGRVEAGANAASAYRWPFIGSFDPKAADAATRKASHRLLGEGARDQELRGQALRYATSHPVPLAPALIVRVLRTFDVWPPGNERAVHAARGVAVGGWLLQWISFLPLLALAGWGLRRSWPAKRGPLLPLFLAPLVIALVALFAYGEPLMRGAIDPVLAIAAAIPLAALRQRPAASGEEAAEQPYEEGEGSRPRRGRGLFRPAGDGRGSHG